MKFCTLLICCCVLMVENGMGQQSGTKTKTPQQPYQNNSRQQPTAHQDGTTNQSFSSKLYEEVKKSQPQNFILSPFSLRNALAMLSLGATGQTAKDMQKLLQFSDDKYDLIRGQSNLTTSFKRISSRNSGVKFVTADKIYVKSGLELRQPYQNQVIQLGGEIENMDFSNTRVAAKNINSWVHNKTEGKIEKLVEASALTRQTSLLILNSIYFKGSWENKFDNSSTRKKPFYINGSCSVNVEMMTQKNKFQLADLEEAKAQVLILPYRGGRLSMMVYLPKGKEETSLDSLENWLADKSPFDIQRERLNNSFIDVSVSLPKFKIRSSLDLNEPLKKLGLGKMFNSATANFSGIFYSFGNLHVSKVSQETFVEVNEEGTEAAAATGIKIVTTSFSPTPEFTADRPFLFQIVDSRTKTVFFSGRVKNPLDSGSGKSPASAGQTEESTCLNVVSPASSLSSSSSSLNSNGGLKTTNNNDNDLATRVAKLEKFMEGRVDEKAEADKLFQDLKETVESLKSKVQTLELQLVHKNEDKNPASGNPGTSSGTGKPTTANRKSS